jgi:hypothetical protein
VIGAILPFSPLSQLLGFASLPLEFFLILLAMIVAYLLLAEVVKARFYKQTPPQSAVDVAAEEILEEAQFALLIGGAPAELSCPANEEIAGGRAGNAGQARETPNRSHLLPGFSRGRTAIPGESGADGGGQWGSRGAKR